MRKALAIIVVAGALSGAPARGQETLSEEMKARARLMDIMPADAAKRHFGGVRTAATGAPRTIGSYAKGCIAGAAALPVQGSTWQVMRTSRNRNWGHPDMIALLERLAKRGPKEANWSGLLVGDISQPRGGPMLTGHASHQLGLDADVWLTPKPARRLSEDELETMPATNAVASDWMDIDPRVWTPAHREIVRLAALEPRVTRIFVNPAIKKAMCRDPGADRAWLNKIRPMWGHNYHFHIRIACPDGDATCVDQDPPPDGDGCGREITDWLAQQHRAIFGPKRPVDPDAKPKPPRFMPLSEMPEGCQQIVLKK